ncbi:MAG: hypothetical protein HYY25_01050 [Candidatus Wallbacteria bacterium]|nr:hypothetical protein [Candidatus Wallbacteria bacterium]
MFTEFINNLARIERFDRAVSSRDIKVGEVEAASGAPQLAIQVPTGETLTLEPRARAQLLGQWQIPAPYFDRLPRQLQAAELTHFTRSQPKELTVRAVHEPSADGSAARAFLSGKYTAFDNTDVLQAVEPYLASFEVQRPDIHRDEMVLVATRPEVHDVSTRRVGDLVKVGLQIRNSEVGEMSVGVDFVLWRLACLNGLVSPQAEVSIRQRHIWIDRRAFVVQLRNAVANVAEIGEGMVRQLRAAHDLALPNLDPDAGKLQGEVVRMLKREGVWTREFQKAATEALSSQEEASLFGLVQFLTGAYAKQAGLAERISRERLAGKLMALAT